MTAYSNIKSNNYPTERLFNAIHSYCSATGAYVATVLNLLQEGADIEARNSNGYTPLLLACFYRDLNNVELLIELGANVDCCNGNGYTVLHYASIYCWLHLVRFLVKKVPNINVQDNSGETALHHVSRLGYLCIVKCLVEEGADIDTKNFVDFTPLLYAAQSAHKDIVDLLLNSGANVDGSEGLLLYYASRNGWADVVQSLVKRIPNLNKRYVIDDTALSITSSSEYLKVVKRLVEKETDRNKRMICQAALHEASSKGHLEVVKWLVKKGPNMSTVLDLNVREAYGYTALLSALHWEYFLSSIRVPHSSQLEVAKFLVEEGVDINIRDEQGVTALHIATYSGNLEMVEYLVERGADINIPDEYGKTVLHKASSRGFLEIVKYYVEKGINIDVPNANGYTPILSATANSQKDVVDLLMYCGANINVFNCFKSTLLHMVSAQGWLDIVQSLVKKGCDLEARNIKGVTPLGKACLSEHFYTIQYLLQAGASCYIENKNGSSPLNYLTRKKRPEFKVIKLLIDNGAYLKPVDYDALVKKSSVKVLQDIELCCQSVLNKFNNRDLSELYKLPVSRRLPCIEKIKIAGGSEVAKAIERALEFEIQTKGHCTIHEVCPMGLGIFAVRSILEYNKEKEIRIKK